jgi:hypothetical protein
MRLMATCWPVNGNVCAAGVAGAAGCGRTGLSIKLPAMVPPITVMDASVDIFMNSPRVAYNLTALRCDADFELAIVFEP